MVVCIESRVYPLVVPLQGFPFVKGFKTDPTKSLENSEKSLVSGDFLGSDLHILEVPSKVANCQWKLLWESSLLFPRQA